MSTANTRQHGDVGEGRSDDGGRGKPTRSARRVDRGGRGPGGPVHACSRCSNGSCRRPSSCSAATPARSRPSTRQAGTYRKEVDLGVECQEGRVFPLDRGHDRSRRARSAGPVVFDSLRRGAAAATSSPPTGHGCTRRSPCPIEWDGSIIGACVVFSTDPDKRFTDEDVAILSLFAKHAAHRDHQRPPARRGRRTGRATWPSPRSASGSCATSTTPWRGLSARSSCTSTPRRARDRAGPPRRRANRCPLGPRRDPAHGARPRPGPARAPLARRRDRARAGLGALGQRPPHRPRRHRRGARIAPEVAPAGAADRAGGADQRRRARPGAAGPRRRLLRLRRRRARRSRTTAPGSTSSSSTCAARTGLGLNGIVARAHQLGADLEIESNRGWGTRVRARVPYDGNLVGHRAASRGALWRVLVVHHRPVVRAGLVRLLASAEPQIQVVGEIGDARDVVDAVRVLEPDVVLLELQMPGLDGARLTSYIRAGEPGRRRPAHRRRAVRRPAARRHPQRRAGLRRLRHRRPRAGARRPGSARGEVAAHRERAAAVRRVATRQRRETLDRAGAARSGRSSSRACRTSRSPPG